MADAAAPPGSRPRRWSTVLFTALMLGLTALFAVLGLWQLDRLGQKERLIATAAARLAQPARALPPLAEWVGFDAEAFDYRRFAATGTWAAEQTVLVFTSLGEPRGGYSGAGYWVMTPLALATGGTLFVNRGFIPQASAEAFATGGPLAAGEVTVEGVARVSEQAGSFTPGADRQRRIEWVRDTDRLGGLLSRELQPVAPIYLDLPASEAGALPQGGEPAIDFPNNHLGYALTWFGFAVLTPALLAFWLLRRRREAATAEILADRAGFH